jgi:hypothetical protein
VTFDRRRRASVTFAARIAVNVTLGRWGAPSATLTAARAGGELLPAPAGHAAAGAGSSPRPASLPGSMSAGMAATATNANAHQNVCA